MSKQVNTVSNDDGVVLNLFGGPCPLKPRSPADGFTPCGVPVIYRADLSFDGKLHKIAKRGQKFDLDGMIQAAVPSTDIAAIVARAKMGDESVLHVNPGFVGDSVNLPKDLYDYKRMNDLYDKVNASFGTLPPEVQALFNNDSSVYLNSIISNKAEKIISDFKASQNQGDPTPEGDK